MKTLDPPEFVRIIPKHWDKPGWSVERKKGVPTLVYHWAANAGATLQNMWDYFQRVATKRVGYHALVKDEIWQTIPWGMTSRALFWEDPCNYPIHTQERFGKCAWPDDYVFNILMLEDDDEGHFSEKTQKNGIYLGAFLCWYYQADPINDVMMHTEVDGKGIIYGTDGYTCPRFFYENPDEWECFKVAIEERIVKWSNGVNYGKDRIS